MPVIVTTKGRKVGFFRTLDDDNETPTYLDKGTKLKRLNEFYYYREKFAYVPYYKVQDDILGVGYVPVEMD